MHQMLLKLLLLWGKCVSVMCFSEFNWTKKKVCMQSIFKEGIEGIQRPQAFLWATKLSLATKVQWIPTAYWCFHMLVLCTEQYWITMFMQYPLLMIQFVSVKVFMTAVLDLRKTFLASKQHVQLNRNKI